MHFSLNFSAPDPSLLILFSASLSLDSHFPSVPASFPCLARAIPFISNCLFAGGWARWVLPYTRFSPASSSPPLFFSVPPSSVSTPGCPPPFFSLPQKRYPALEHQPATFQRSFKGSWVSSLALPLPPPRAAVGASSHVLELSKLMWLIMMQIVLDGYADETGEYRLNKKFLQSLRLLHNLTSGLVSVVVGATRLQNIVLKHLGITEEQPPKRHCCTSSRPEENNN
ncbi:uncharacterized protein LOC118502325 [Phyllostomus discolor]|uniref:Uncharacterized protein LOC118502325 n=1 Tax=Phyllostomus discolor TaxID=89673 RepID=A0A7E6EHB8_9CHIR|nr:uncharacterized protein LOC118502325 [Phyllostomus discolor]